VYPISQAETAAMETYVSKSLHQGYIRSSTSPASSSFFFVKKKEGGLCPCIDYRGLNQNTMRYSYPVPLIATVIESMHGAHFFTKLERLQPGVYPGGRRLSVPPQRTMSTSSCRTG
jgi:hypothetical protein